MVEDFISWSYIPRVPKSPLPRPSSDKASGDSSRAKSPASVQATFQQSHLMSPQAGHCPLGPYMGSPGVDHVGRVGKGRARKPASWEWVSSKRGGALLCPGVKSLRPILATDLFPV